MKRLTASLGIEPLSRFRLIADDFGLLMLEVKGWYAGQLAVANDHGIELHKSQADQTRVEVHKQPIRKYLFGLMGQLARPEHAILFLAWYLPAPRSNRARVAEELLV